MTILEVNAHFYLEQDVEEDFVQLIDDREGSFFFVVVAAAVVVATYNNIPLRFSDSSSIMLL